MTALCFSIRDFEYARLIRLGESFLDVTPATIVSAINPKSPGSPHDYCSDADYWWQNPNDPDGPYIHRDGLSNPDNFTVHRELLRDFARQFGALTAAWRVSGDPRYAAMAERHLHAWFVDDATKMNPNLQYAQAIKGKCTGRGIGIIDTLHLAEVAIGAKALGDAGVLPVQCFSQVSTWFAEYLEWICTHPYGIDERDMKNNHGSCWALQAAAFAVITGDSVRLNECRARLLDIFLPDQMAPDGSFPEELRRTKPYAYSMFNLDVLCGLATLCSRESGEMMRHSLPDGRGLLRGVEFIHPFIRDKRTWPKQPDVMYWHEWPVRQPCLLFGALAAGREDWLELWKSLDPDPKVLEIRRNYPIRNPVLWLD